MNSRRKRIGWWGLILMTSLGMIYVVDAYLWPTPEREDTGSLPVFQEQSPQATFQPAKIMTATTPARKSQAMRRPTATLPPPTSLPTVTATPTVTGTIHHIVAGDTFLQLANDYGVSLEAVLRANADLDPTALQIGQTVFIPGGSAPLDPEPTPAPPVTAKPRQVADLETAIFQAVNAERQEQGLHLYILDEELATVARAHAQDMASRGYFDHVTPEGKTLRDRLREAGIEKHWVGENIQANTHRPDQAVTLTIGWFMESQPHRENILAEPYTRLGVGVIEQPPGWFTYVLVFAGES